MVLFGGGSLEVRKHMKKLICLGLFLVTILLPSMVEAKVLPQAGKSAPKQTSGKISGATIGVSPKVRPDRRAVIVNFSNLQNAANVSYQFIYSHDGQQEGAMGGVTLNGQTNDKSELLFATCSNNVCRYHSGIKDARLEVSYTSVTGKKYLKKFKIKL
jgi:hypothetical protein